MKEVKTEWCKDYILYLEKQSDAVNLDYRNKIFEALDEKAEREKGCKNSNERG